MLGNVSVVCFLASYVLAFGLECRRARHGNIWVRRVMLLVGAAGLVAHSTYLVNRSRQAELPPLLSSSHDWLLVLAWLIVTFLLVFTLVDKQLKIGLFLFPLVLILIVSAYFVSLEPNNLLIATDGGGSRLQLWAMFHATLLVFGVAGVILGLVFSLMYLVQHTRLKKAQTGGELHLPSLAVLSRLNWWAVMISVPLLTLGILSGVLLGLSTTEVQQKISFADPVVTASSLVWVVMVVLFFYLVKTDRPATRQMAWLTIWAFSFLLVTLLAVQILTGNSSWVESWHAATPGIQRGDGVSGCCADHLLRGCAPACVALVVRERRPSEVLPS